MHRTASLKCHDERASRDLNVIGSGDVHTLERLGKPNSPRMLCVLQFRVQQKRVKRSQFKRGLRVEGVTKTPTAYGSEQRDNGIKHHIVQILRVRIHGCHETQSFRLYFGTLGQETVTGDLSKSAQDLLPEKGHGTSTVDRLHQRRNNLEQRALGQRQLQRREKLYLHQRCCMRSTFCVVTTKS